MRSPVVGSATPQPLYQVANSLIASASRINVDGIDGRSGRMRRAVKFEKSGSLADQFKRFIRRLHK